MFGRFGWVVDVDDGDIRRGICRLWNDPGCGTARLWTVTDDHLRDIAAWNLGFHVLWSVELYL